MKKLSLVLLALASLLGTAGVASAQYYYGGGYYYDHPRYYHHRDYDHDYDDYRWRHRYWRYRHHNPCPRGFTVQDGVCKPYRGY